MDQKMVKSEKKGEGFHGGMGAQNLIFRHPKCIKRAEENFDR